MPIRIYAISFGLIAIMTGCKSTDTNGSVNTSNPSTAPTPGTMASPASTTTTSTVKGKVDPCKLLTNDDLKEVQGEAPKEAQRSDREQGGFVVAQCYYSLPTTSNSVVLNVTTASEAGGARDPKEFWKDTFGRKLEKDHDRDREGKPKKGEEEEQAVPPQKIAAVGDDAYWVASRVGGALYVLKKDLFFRISVGGAGDAKSKLNKSKTLARKALGRI